MVIVEICVDIYIYLWISHHANDSCSRTNIYGMCVKSFDPIFHLILGKSKLRVEWIHV